MPDRKNPAPDPLVLDAAKKRWPDERRQRGLALFDWCVKRPDKKKAP